jgi:cytochrome c peroxidase
MDSNWGEILDKLGRSPEYRARFQALYPNGLQSRNVKDAIAVFERSLTTPDSRFDQYLRGNRHALTAGEKRGYTLFKEYGCASCHQGAAVGGNLYQTFGVVSTYLKAQAKRDESSPHRSVGREAAPRAELFKVPGLRNVALTAPYFHQGDVGRLDEAVRLMARHQLGRKLDAAEVDQIVAFLRTLTGRYQDRRL